MRAKLTSVDTIEKAANPTLRFVLELDLDPAKEVIVGATGALFFPRDVLLAPLFEIPDHEQIEFPLRASPVPTGPLHISSKRWLRLGAQLSQRDIDYIESHREKDKRGDVTFVIQVKLSTLVSTADSWAAGTTVLSDKGAPVLVRAQTPTGKAVLWEDPNKGFLLERAFPIDEQYIIAGTNWIHDFAPRLGLGRFAIVEIPVISSPVGLGKRIDRATKAADDAETRLRAGEWDDVCKDLRGVWEAFKGYDFIKDVAVKDGYSEDAAKFLNEAFQNLFDLASKFGHVLGRDKKTVLPELHAKKEDAYTFYLLAR